MPILQRRSYSETVEGRRRLLSRLKLVGIVFLAFELVSGLLLNTYAIATSSMGPGIQARDRLLASPLLYGPRTIFGKIPALVKPSHGDVAILDPVYAEPLGFWAGLLDAGVRFFSFQQISLHHGDSDARFSGPLIERVIALPGDEIYMEDFVFKVRRVGESHFLTEFELSSHRYDIEKPSLPEGWRGDYPLSGSMPHRILGRDEYFVAGDDRGSSSDSRHWGPVSLSRFRAKVLLRYWPVKRFGLP